jgi:hypothetical protein
MKTEVTNKVQKKVGKFLTQSQEGEIALIACVNLLKNHRLGCNNVASNSIS